MEDLSSFFLEIINILYNNNINLGNRGFVYLVLERTWLVKKFTKFINLTLWRLIGELE